MYPKKGGGPNWSQPVNWSKMTVPQWLEAATNWFHFVKDHDTALCWELVEVEAVEVWATDSILWFELKNVPRFSPLPHSTVAPLVLALSSSMQPLMKMTVQDVDPSETFLEDLELTVLPLLFATARCIQALLPGGVPTQPSRLNGLVSSASCSGSLEWTEIVSFVDRLSMSDKSSETKPSCSLQSWLSRTNSRNPGKTSNLFAGKFPSSRYLNRTSACHFRTITSDGGGRRVKPVNNWPRYSIKIPRRCLWIALVRRAAWPFWPALRQRRFLRWAAMTPATLVWNLSLDRLLPLDGAGGGKGGIHSLALQVLLLQWNTRVALA